MMIFDPQLKAGEVLSNAEVMKLFHCACEGGVRPARATDSIVIVLNHTIHSHEKDWQGGRLLFRGSGAKGDQTLEKGRNRTLLESFRNGRPVYLFEVYKPKQYTFRGRVELAAEPFPRTEPDSQGMERLAWIFPLRLAS